MKYILDQEEYDNLLSDKNYRKLNSSNKMKSLVKTIAEYVPVATQGDCSNQKPHGCIHSVNVRALYCTTDCPAVWICPLPKHWSK